MQKKDLYELMEKLDGFIDELNRDVIDPLKKFDTARLRHGLSLHTVKKYQGKKQRNSKNVRKLSRDMIVSSFMKNSERSVSEYFARKFSICCAMQFSECPENAASEDDIRALLEITGYGVDELLREWRSFHDREMHLNPYAGPFILILASSIYDAYTKNRRDRLREVTDYLYGRKILYQGDPEETMFTEFYEKYALLHFREDLIERAAVIVRDIIEEKAGELDAMTASVERADMQEMMNDPDFFSRHRNEKVLEEGGSRGFLIERPQDSVAKTDSILECRNSLYALGEKADIILDEKREEAEETKAEYIRRFSGLNIGECAVDEILRAPDDTWECPIFWDIGKDICGMMPIPINTVDYVLPEDYDDWNELFVEYNGKLGLRIWDFNEVVKGEEEIWNDSGMESRNTPVLIPSLIAHYAEHRVPESLYIRKSIVEIFRNAGLSGRRARDAAIIVAFCNQLNCRDADWHNSRWLTEDLRSCGKEPIRDEVIPEKVKKEVPPAPPVRNQDTEESAEKDLRIMELERKLSDAEHRASTYRHQILELERKIGEIEEKKNRQREEIPEPVANAAVTSEEIPEIEYPYSTDMKITLFGGFDSFHREIEKLIPGIRIIEPSARLSNTDPLTNADMVFFQPNKMDHSNYYAARNAVKNADVPSWHLRWASARRCADFMVRRIEERK